MDWNELEKQFDIIIPDDEPVYPLNIVCGLLHLHYWTVHEILREGIIHPSKKAKSKKLFSRKDIKRLKYVKYLMEEKGVNVKGIKVIFEIQGER